MVTIRGTTQLLGVIGYPIAHSLSPVMHNAAIAQLGVDGVYVPFPIAPENLQTAIAGLAAVGVQGFNVTIPHKQTIIPLLASMTPEAIAVGAVNTVWRTEEGWAGTNTDVLGFVAPLSDRPWAGKTAVVLGNGGAARAVVVGCAQLGMERICVVGRNADKLAAFLQSWQELPLAGVLSVHPWEELPSLLPAAQLVVNTTPIGMHPHPEQSPLSLTDFALLPQGAIAYDLIYTPRPTQFLNLASQTGAIALDGLEMLVQQGAAALERWLHRPVPVDTMRHALQHHLGLPS